VTDTASSFRENVMASMTAAMLSRSRWTRPTGAGRLEGPRGDRRQLETVEFMGDRFAASPGDLDAPVTGGSDLDATDTFGHSVRIIFDRDTLRASAAAQGVIPEHWPQANVASPAKRP